MNTIFWIFCKQRSIETENILQIGEFALKLLNFIDDILLIEDRFCSEIFLLEDILQVWCAIHIPEGMPEGSDFNFN